MKGHRAKEKEKRISRTKRPWRPAITHLPMYLTPLDLFPLEPTKENVFQYLVDSYWVEAQVIKIMGFENPIIDDVIAEIYLLIYDKLDHLLDIYERRGILAFCGYIKTVVSIQAKYPIHIQEKLYGKLKTVGMSKEMEKDIDEQYDPERDDIYHIKSTVII